MRCIYRKTVYTPVQVVCFVEAVGIYPGGRGSIKREIYLEENAPLTDSSKKEFEDTESIESGSAATATLPSHGAAKENGDAFAFFASSGGTGSERKSRNVIVWVLVGLILFFLLSFFNRFAALRSGDGEYASGIAMLSGRLPYRDYFVTAPPGNMLKSLLLLKIFGPALIVSRTAGVLERLLIGIVLLRWLLQLFRPWHALLASVVTMVVSTGDRTDPIASYNHDAILFAMIAGLATSLVLEGGSERRTLLLAMASGGAAALSLLTKQTVGIGILFCLGIAGVVLLPKVEGRRHTILWCAGFAAGWVVPMAALGAWLWKMELLRTMLRMMFITGPAAKAGHASDFILRTVQVAWNNPTWLLPGLVGLGLSWGAIRRGLDKEPTEAGDQTRQLQWVALAGVLVIGVAELLAYTALPALRDFSKSAVYFAFLGLTFWLVSRIPSIVRLRMTRRAAQQVLFGAVAWSIAVMLSLSWPVFEAMALPGLGFLLCATLAGVRDRFKWFPLLVMAAMVFIQVREKLDLPFTFDHLSEAPVRFEQAASVQPQLSGMRFSPGMVRFLDETVALVVRQTRPDDSIFTYPEMGILYPLTGRWPPTRSGSHNIDVMNDAFAREEAQRLRQARPAVIIYYRLTEEQLQDDEKIWRGGRRSGQRDIIAAVEDLVAGYRLAGTYVVAPGDPPINVYVRP